MTRYTVVGLAAGLLAAAVIAAAPPASAGCQQVNAGWQLCDGPIQPDGIWQRCEVETFPDKWTKSTCFPLGNTNFLPPFQPPGHIDP
jgi:hypothetical protein